MTKISRRLFLKKAVAGLAVAAVAPSLASCEELGGDSHKIRKIAPLAGKYDVVVVGGGPAGFIAAIAAARQGAKTAIIERYGFFGGMATIGYVAPISVFALKNELVIGGIPWEFVKRLESMGGAFIEWPKANIDFDIELYKLCCQRMILEAGIDIYTHSAMVGCEMEGKSISSVIIENKNGLETLESKVFIDCTGDGDLAHMAEVPMQPNPEGELQPSSFCFILSGVDTKSDLLNKCMYHNGINGPSQCKPVREKLLAMKAAGVDLPDFGGPWFNNVMHEGSVAVNITRRAADSTNNRNFSAVECQLREDIFTFTRVLKENFKEFKNCYVSATAPQAGIRESRRILGVHTVTADEYVNAFRYEDSISRGIHPIDIHASKGTHQTRIDLTKPAYVPYRALITAEYPNLLVAGRCISTDRQALASLRVMASCMGTGQAAGAAAAQCVANNQTVQNIDTAQLVATLKEWGAVL
ncbi:MAG: FAD-dependent oxidoreductase [Alistipes sp.]|nr:FAD-dependent oxidoreductase [Alistipes sp.]